MGLPFRSRRTNPELVVGMGVLLACASAPWGESGTSFRDCTECPEMLVIPPGSFVMGSPVTETGRFDDEGPVHNVTIARQFAVSITPVTRAEYEVFARTTSRTGSSGCASMNAEGNWVKDSSLSWENPGFDQTPEHPVVCVSWDEGQAYAAWLAQKTGRAYRLLSETEFEYVARAGSNTTFPWGATDEGMCANANGFDASAGKAHPDWPAAACDDGYAFTAPVQAFPANAFGVYGASGNVFQWTEDCFLEGGYAGAPTDGSARSTENCEPRVIRGGSWLNSARGLRVAMRDRDLRRDRYTNVGLRVALSRE